VSLTPEPLITDQIKRCEGLGQGRHIVRDARYQVVDMREGFLLGAPADTALGGRALQEIPLCGGLQGVCEWREGDGQGGTGEGLSPRPGRPGDADRDGRERPSRGPERVRHGLEIGRGIRGCRDLARLRPLARSLEPLYSTFNQRFKLLLIDMEGTLNQRFKLRLIDMDGKLYSVLAVGLQELVNSGFYSGEILFHPDLSQGR
jgi:hypothetical protein